MVQERVAKLLPVLSNNSLDALIVPSQDAHQTEMVAKKDQRRAWLSGFTGSAGIALVVKETPKSVKGYLWTDGRYFIQAAEELDASVWTLMKSTTEGTPTLASFIQGCAATALKVGSKKYRVGLDPRFVSQTMFVRWHHAMNTISNDPKSVGAIEVELVPIVGLIDEVMVNDAGYLAMIEEEATREIKVWQHPIEFCGESTESKVNRIRNYIADNYMKEYANAQDFAYVIQDLSHVCWTMNMRGKNVIECSPVFFAYIIITAKDVMLFSDFPADEELEIYLEGIKSTIGLQVFEYDSFSSELHKVITPGRLVILPTSANYHTYNQCKTIIEKLGAPIKETLLDENAEFLGHFQAIKNQVELKQMIDTSLNDSVSLTRYLHWLEMQGENICNMDEIQVADRLEAFRKEIPDFDGLSFPTISSYASNAAIIHYIPEKGNPLLKKLGTESLYLVDSGGQYKSGGTTDVTRTVCLGKPDSEMKKYFTLVLDGHAKLAAAKFAYDTNSRELDNIARASLKANGVNYAHGTSHGVGTFLNVHESPPYFGLDQLEPGMCISNEPGYYAEGKYGVRIESVVIVTEDKANKESPLGFTTLNLVPMQLRLIDPVYLSETGRKWVNDFHKECFQKVGTKLKEMGLNDVYAWLQASTIPL